MAPADVDMSPVPKADKDKDAAIDEKAVAPKQGDVDPVEALISDLRRGLALLEKAVAGKELRLIARMLRGTGSLRPRLTAPLVARFVRAYVPAAHPARDAVLAALAAVPEPQSRDVPMKPADEPAGQDLPPHAAAAPNNVDAKKSQAALLAQTPPSSLPEVAAYLQLLAVLVLIDAKRHADAATVSKALVDFLAKHNRRTLDEISARAFFYYSRAAELTNSLSSIRAHLLAAYRTAVLRHDVACQAMLVNLLLRNYIEYNLFDQADKLVSRAPFPETRSNNQLARNMYFTGRIKAIQLNYTEASWCLQQALRKAPQHSALGFRITVQKFMIIVQLLTGEIPERSVFSQANMKDALLPYLKITKAVRIGDLGLFKEVTEASSDVFVKDKTASLIIRLRHNVIKTGLRKLNVSYSQISLKDVSDRLELDSAEDAEGVVAKAIHDGVIDAVIDNEGGFVQSKENMDVYSTTEPADAYHSRIQFCLNVYNEAIRAMRFPDNKEEDETPEQRRERLKEQEELVKTLGEEDDEDDSMMFE
jgi:26S proteasome regulatory subunit N3